MKIALYGGTFDPPHIGHMWVAEQISQTVDEVWMYCSNTGQECNKQPTAYIHRKNMLSNMVKEFGDYKIISPAFPDVTYTYELIKAVKFGYPDYTFVLVVGSDWDIESFKEYEYIQNNCEICIINRDGYDNKNTGLQLSLKIDFKLSSTEIRERLKYGLVTKGLIMPSVESYIQKNNLYK